MRLLITRPEAEAQRNAQTLRAHGHDVLLAAVLRIDPVPATIPDGPWSAVLMTSANAARSVAGHPAMEQLKGVGTFVVGARTAHDARRAGFRDVTSADGNAASLASLLAGRFRGEHARLLYLCGEQRAFDLAGALRRDAVEVCSVEVYRTVTADRLTSETEAALRAGSVDGVLHFSRRSAEGYLTCAARGGSLAAALRPAHYCLSPQIARVLNDAGALRVSTAAQPDEAALLALIE